MYSMQDLCYLACFFNIIIANLSKILYKFIYHTFAWSQKHDFYLEEKSSTSYSAMIDFMSLPKGISLLSFYSDFGEISC